MSQPTPTPADDEVEQRLDALKHGADPSSLGSEPAADKPAGSRGPVLSGDVIDGGRTWAARSTTPGGVPGGGGPRGGGRSGGRASRSGPGVRAVSWSWDQARTGRLGLWLGVGLVAFGGYLVLAQFVPGFSLLGSVAVAVVGVVLVVWHLTGRAGTWALYGGAILAGFGLVRAGADLAGAPSAGWGTLGAGLGLLGIAARRAARRGGVGWQAWLGLLLVVFGGWGAVGALVPGFPTLGDLIVPVILVLIGASFLRRSLR